MIAIARPTTRLAVPFVVVVVISLLAMLAPVSAVALMPTPQRAKYIAANENVFLQDEIARVDITIDPADFQALLDDPRSDEYKLATMRWQNSRIDVTLPDVGFRPRGGRFTRSATRKSWSIDINDFAPSRDFFGLEKINLNGDHNDPTFLRRRMSHYMMRRMGLPAPRISFVALYINGKFWSIQINTEHIDEEYAQSWFGNKRGNLYKCLNPNPPADLSKVEGEDYKALGNGRVYQETNNDPESDYTDLVAFIRFINDSDPATFFADLEKHLNVDSFLRYLALNVAVGNWDEYWYGANNYYLYRNTDTNRFEWIPYDYDQSLGMDYFKVNWSTRPFDIWGDGGFGSTPAPLVAAVFQHAEWRRQYRRYLMEAADLLNDPQLPALLDTWHQQILPWFDGTIESGGAVGTATTSGQHNPYFITGRTEPATWNINGSFHCMGIVPYMQTRRQSLLQQLATFDTPALPTIRINELQASNPGPFADEFGEFDDWIELYNFGSQPVDIGGMHLTDDVLNPLKWEIPLNAGVIPPGGYLVVWADNSPNQGPLHAPFALSTGGEFPALYHTTAMGRVLIDAVVYPALPSGLSYGVVEEDSIIRLATFCNPTPLAANGGPEAPCEAIEPLAPPRVVINEFMASNSSASGFADEFGEYDDWIELYNLESFDVDLSGMHLTDNLGNPTKWRFPNGVVIPAEGYLIIWADSTPAQGPLHTSWALSANGEAIGLFDTVENNLRPIDTHTFGPQLTNVSEGRLPNGTGSFQQLSQPSPGESNDPPVSGWVAITN